MNTQSEVVGVIMKSTPSPPPPAFVRVSERDLTEIELHSVDSINDLHRTHSEQHSKGVQPPRPPPPSSNGNLPMQDGVVVYQTGQPVRRPCVSRLNDICTSTRRHYFLACAAIIAFLLILILIFSFLVQQSNALHTLLEMVKQKQETAKEISQLLQELQKQRHNLTEQRP